MAATTVNKEVKYLNKDFSQFRDNLINFAKHYFPNTYNDFNESDPGMMFIEMAAYVGDTLSYYIDSQLKESLLAYAEEKSNLYALAQTFGYKPKISIPAVAELSLYQLLPAKAGGGGNQVPDWDYALTIAAGGTFQADTTKFVLQSGVDFSFSSSNDPTNVSVYSFAGNQPTWFLLEKKVKVISGEIKTVTFNFGAPKKFTKALIEDESIISIYDVVDSNGDEWYEVPYLAQDTIFDKMPNVYANDPNLAQYAVSVPYILRLKRVPKRFVTRVTENAGLEMQFGAGMSINPDETIIPNPDNVGQGIPADERNIDFDIDPSNFMYTGAYGQVPYDTTLTVRYLAGGGISANVLAGSINRIGAVVLGAKNPIDPATFAAVKNSLACTNIQPAVGGRSGETNEEIRQNALGMFGTQNRAVTLDDYAVRCYSMPPDLGGVSKVFITQDDQLSLYDLRSRLKNPLALNFYCLGYDANKNLITLNPAAKLNLKTFLSQYKMLSDAINIKDAYIINFRVEFEVLVFPEYNSNEVLLTSIAKLKDYFDINKWQINQPINKAEVYAQVMSVPGVQAVVAMRFVNKAGQGSGYSPNSYDFRRADKNGVIYPSLDPCIFEIKYPNTDIVGRVTTL